jgi:hypothetical protein
MTIEDTIKKLRNDRIWNLVYNKWKKRRSRNKEKLSLRRCREKALIEYYTLKEQVKYDNKTPENIEPLDYYVMVGGKPMLNSEWQKLIQLQKELGDTKINPSPNWELQSIHYLKSLFRDD